MHRLERHGGVCLSCDDHSAVVTARAIHPDLCSEDYQRRGPVAPDLEQYQAMHGLTADRAANEFACDLLVVGAYSHSRLRQLILGGVTRHVLEHATIPLMMHR